MNYKHKINVHTIHFNVCSRNYCVAKEWLQCFHNYTKLCSVACPPTESTPPLAYLVRSPATLSALDIEGTSSTAHEEETNWSLQAAGVSPPSTRAPRVHSNTPLTEG